MPRASPYAEMAADSVDNRAFGLTGTSLATGRSRDAGREDQADRRHEALKQSHYLSGALKALLIPETTARLADNACDAGWTHEEYLAAVLGRAVMPETQLAPGCGSVPSGSVAPKTLEEFDWHASTAARANRSTALASAGFWTKARNVVLLGPPGTGKTHLLTGPCISRDSRPPSAVRHRNRLGRPAFEARGRDLEAEGSSATEVAQGLETVLEDIAPRLIPLGLMPSIARRPDTDGERLPYRTALDQHRAGRRFALVCHNSRLSQRPSVCPTITVTLNLKHQLRRVMSIGAQSRAAQNRTHSRSMGAPSCGARAAA